MTTIEALKSEMKRYLPIIEALEKEPELWMKFTKGTGVATANGYRNALASLEKDEYEKKFTLTDMLNCFAFGRECEYAEHFGAVPNRCTKEIYFKKEFNIDLKNNL